MLARVAAFNRRINYLLYQAASYAAGGGALFAVIAAAGVGWVPIVGAFAAFTVIASGSFIVLVRCDMRHLRRAQVAACLAEFDRAVADLRKDQP